MMNKLMTALAAEYEAVYLIDLEQDSFEILKPMECSTAMTSSNRWSEAGRAFTRECAPETRKIVLQFSDTEYIKTLLARTDSIECTFRHSSDNKWRKGSVRVLERREEMPSKVLMNVYVIDRLSYQKEKLLQNVLLSEEFEAEEKQEEALSGENGQSLFDGLKILLVEDNEILRMVSRETLEMEGALVEEAVDGQEAVDLITSGNRFDFIIMDILMPVMNGIEATRRIMEYQKNAEVTIPILGLTADSTGEQRKEILEAGAFACLSKPLKPREMSRIFISCMRERSLFMEEKMAEINLLANTDLLTQAGNVVAYARETEALSVELESRPRGVAIVVCDLDNLKGINDTYGHDVGDIYIKNCSRAVKEAFPDSALYRIGGDEFAVVVKDEALGRIAECMKKLNERSGELSSIKDVIQGKVSVSAGYAVFDEEVDRSLLDTRKRADGAMYENKRIHKQWSEVYTKISEW